MNELKIEDFNNHTILKHAIASSYGKGSNKKIEVVIDIIKKKIHFEIKNHGEVVESTLTLKDAIDSFNFYY